MTDNSNKVEFGGKGGGVIGDSNHSLIGFIHCGKVNSSCEGLIYGLMVAIG